MINWIYCFIFEIALLISGMIYGHTRERREEFFRRFLLGILVYIGICLVGNLLVVNHMMELSARIIGRSVGFLLLFGFHQWCLRVDWTISAYDTIWAAMSWQLIYELWSGISMARGGIFFNGPVRNVCGIFLSFLVGHVVAYYTIARFLPEGGGKRIGPRQLASATLIFFTFEFIGFDAGGAQTGLWEAEFLIVYLSQLMLALILYLQNELFKKSALRQELAVMNLLWKKEQEQYQLSKENIALINQKCHDLKHQIRAIRNSSKEDMDKYLEEMEGSIQIYESMVQTGNEVLDTILTEKSLICREKGITVSCVADGSQMEFINTVDLYAILGNALDNAMEAVEKFKHQEKRQIDVLIYRQQNFLVMNIMNPLKGELVYEEELPVTTKGDKSFHGFGLKSMKYMVKKYDGFLSVSTEDGCFSLKILIPIPEIFSKEAST